MFFQKNGERGIRTLGGLLNLIRLPIVHLRPLGHLSKGNSAADAPKRISTTTANMGIEAEREGFEPSVTYEATSDFESDTFDHSDIFPNNEHYYNISRFQNQEAFGNALN